MYIMKIGGFCLTRRSKKRYNSLSGFKSLILLSLIIVFRLLLWPRIKILTHIPRTAMAESKKIESQHENFIFLRV